MEYPPDAPSAWLAPASAAWQHSYSAGEQVLIEREARLLKRKQVRFARTCLRR